jgi:hypothetical protein
MAKKKIIEQIVEGQGAEAASAITTLLNQKLKSAIEEQRVVTAQTVYGEGESGNAGIEGRMNYIRHQIKTQGDPGGVRRAALKRLETQIRK